jgi:hypothetical protein
MTNEERDLISQFITRVGGQQQQSQSSFSGSVPATATPPLPPVDPEADRLIGDLFSRYPAAPYRMTQLAFVQEHALTEAQNRIQRLEWELQQARQTAQQGQPQQSSSGGFFSSLFGGGSRSSAPPPQGGPGPAWNRGAQPNYQQGYQQAPPPPQYAPTYQPGMFQRQGSGFLGSALTTAAGVAGGVLAAIGGLMEAGRVSAVTAQQGYGEGIIFPVFAAAVIGGVSLKGGRGNMIGAATGVILLGMVQNILNLANVSSYWIDAINGSVILIALVIARVVGGQATAE